MARLQDHRKVSESLRVHLKKPSEKHPVCRTANKLMRISFLDEMLLTVCPCLVFCSEWISAKVRLTIIEQS